MRENWCKVIILVFLIISMGSLPSRAELRLSEILSAPASDWDGDGAVDSKFDEWVEVVNPGPDPVDLTGVYLRDGTGDAWHYGFSGTLAAGEVLLVTGASSHAWQAANSAGTSGLSLNNTGDRVELWRAPDGGVAELLDDVDVPSHAAASDRALAWLPAVADWILHDGLNPYGGSFLPAGSGCSPSPGAINACTSSVPVEASSVGRLKALFEE